MKGFSERQKDIMMIEKFDTRYVYCNENSKYDMCSFVENYFGNRFNPYPARKFHFQLCANKF